ncbi:class I SAM-dependent methyltransferase [Candidatus Woesearchaeota archaeon]|nr:class I SAM-dependent methyltransferase [Candidatus Woesearchaeota archaeon]
MRKPTNWSEYQSDPNSFLSKHLFLNLVIKAYLNLLENVNLDKPINILEFGAGTGYTNKCLSKNLDVKKITLVDFNKKMLNLSKQTLSDIPSEKEFVEGDFFKVALSEQYDIVHSQGVIEHFEPEKRRELLARHFNSTKPGGYCIVYSPTPTKSYKFFRKAAEILKLWNFPDEVPLDKDTIIKEMESLGFKTLKVNYFWRYFLTEVGILFQRKEFI